MIAIHHGLSTIGNKITSNHTHQGGSDQRLPPGCGVFAWSSIYRRENALELALDSKVFSLVFIQFDGGLNDGEKFAQRLKLIVEIEYLGETFQEIFSQAERSGRKHL
jgi:hypothetical protein